MTQYHLDERDIMFNLKECPGLAPIQELGVFEACDADTLDMIFEQSKSFCQKVLAPLLMSSDREGCRLEDGHVLLPEGVAEAWEQYRELGLIGMNSDSDYGGSELPHFFSVPVTEMECGSFVSFSMLPLLTRGAARLIYAFGSETLKRVYLENMFSGVWTGTMCLTEPHAGSDVGQGSTKAVPEGDHFKISGTKIFITWGEHDLTENIIHLVLARIEGAPRGSKGLSLFVVPKNRVDGQGRVAGPNDVQCGSIEHKMGIKASPTCVINFGTDGDCIGYLVGEPHQGIRYMFQMMNEARIEVGLQGMAQASAAYLSAVEYAKERVQGKIETADGARQAKIIEHPDVRRMLVKMRALVHGSRALIYHLMHYSDLAHHHPTERQKYQALVELMTPVCKSYCSDQGFRVTEMAVQTYGGYGYCQEYPVEQYLRDSKISSIYEGTNGIQAMDLVFRKILMNRGEYLKIWAAQVADTCGEAAGTELAPAARAVQSAVEALVQTATLFGQKFLGKAADVVRFRATEFQEHTGHVMVAHLLLKQGLAALKALGADHGDADRVFYGQKLVTLRYFCAEILPLSREAFQTMQAEEAPGLAAEFA